MVDGERAGGRAERRACASGLRGPTVGQLGRHLLGARRLPGPRCRYCPGRARRLRRKSCTPAGARIWRNSWRTSCRAGRRWNISVTGARGACLQRRSWRRVGWDAAWREWEIGLVEMHYCSARRGGRSSEGDGVGCRDSSSEGDAFLLLACLVPGIGSGRSWCVVGERGAPAELSPPPGSRGSWLEKWEAEPLEEVLMLRVPHSISPSPLRRR